MARERVMKGGEQRAAPGVSTVREAEHELAQAHAPPDDVCAGSLGAPMYAALHAEVADQIHPSLVQRSLWWYWCKQYFLSPLIPSLGTVQLGPGPMNPPGKAKVRSHNSDAPLGDAGTTSERLEFEATA
jgi:hypothetical protein